jgi:poly(3-hydroxybutyrate) depolymerase
MTGSVDCWGRMDTTELAKTTMDTDTDLATHLCPIDTRFSYDLRVPRGRVVPRLVVAVHDSTRNARECLEAFAALTHQHAAAVLAPLFPGDVRGDGNVDGYKFLVEHEIRYDRLLNSMIDEALDRTGCLARRVCMHGYSGGGQFVHRYALIHPERLRAAVIAAPGEVTLLDPGEPWWGGVKDASEVFGRHIDLAALARVPLQLLVGSDDTDTAELKEQPPSRFWSSDDARLRSNRVDRLRLLHRSLREAGVDCTLDVMPGITHGAGTQAAARQAIGFFRRVMLLGSQ